MSENHPSTSHPAAKLPKHNKLKVSRIREKPVIFLVATDRNGTSAPSKALLVFIFFAIVSFFCKVYNSLEFCEVALSATN